MKKEFGSKIMFVFWTLHSKIIFAGNRTWQCRKKRLLSPLYVISFYSPRSGMVIGHTLLLYFFNGLFFLSFFPQKRGAIEEGWWGKLVPVISMTYSQFCRTPLQCNFCCSDYFYFFGLVLTVATLFWLFKLYKQFRYLQIHIFRKVKHNKNSNFQNLLSTDFGLSLGGWQTAVRLGLTCFCLVLWNYLNKCY